MSRDNCDKFQNVNLKQTKVYGYNGIKNSTSRKIKKNWIFLEVLFNISKDVLSFLINERY